MRANDLIPTKCFREGALGWPQYDGMEGLLLSRAASKRSLCLCTYTKGDISKITSTFPAQVFRGS